MKSSLTLAEAIRLLRSRGVNPRDYKHLPPEQIIQLAVKGQVTT